MNGNRVRNTIKWRMKDDAEARITFRILSKLIKNVVQ